MSQLVDTLVTRYTLDASGYKKGADDVKRSTKSAGEAIQSMKDAAGKLSGSLGNVSSAFSNLKSRVMGLLGPIAKFGAVAAATLIGLSAYAINAAVEMDTLQRRLLGVVGDAERAARLWEMTKQLAQESMFETGPVAEATIMLEAFGISAEKWTKLAIVMGSAFGGTTEKLSDFVAILGRLKGGQVSEALGPEGLGRFGISRDVLRQFGAVFDANGSFVGSAEDAMNIIERVVNTKFGAIAKSMESGPMAKLASMWDSVKFAAASAGRVLLTALLPVVERLTGMLTRLIDDGVFERIAQSLLAVFNINAGAGPLANGIRWIESVIRNLPENIVRFANTFVDVFNAMAEGARTVAMFLAVAFGVQIVGTIQTFINFVVTLGKNILELVKAVRKWSVAQAIAWATASGPAALKTVAIMLTGVAVATAGVLAALHAADYLMPEAPKFDHIKTPDFKEPGEPPKPPQFEPLKPGQPGSSGNPVQQALNQIAGNTAATASNTQKQLDMQRYILGGGDLGRLGVTPAEMSGRQGKEVRIKVDSGAATLDDWVSGLVSKAIRELRRRGQL